MDQTIYVFAKWQVKEGQVTIVLDLMKEVANKSRQEEGNQFYTIHQSNTDANTLVLYEAYKDEAALEAHRNAAYFKKDVLEKIVPLLENREVILATKLAAY